MFDLVLLLTVMVTDSFFTSLHPNYEQYLINHIIIINNNDNINNILNLFEHNNLIMKV